VAEQKPVKKNFFSHFFGYMFKHGIIRQFLQTVFKILFAVPGIDFFIGFGMNAFKEIFLLF